MSIRLYIPIGFNPVFRGCSVSVIHMPCPWYQHGLCTSPKLGTPTDAVVSPERCLTEDRYVSCAYFVENLRVGLERRSQRREIRIYAPIHALLYDLEIRCPYAEILKLENGVKIAYCRILERPLTRFEASLCSEHWEKCPYRFTASTLRI